MGQTEQTTEASPYAVNARTCIRCAACATLAPGNFVVKAGPAKLVSAPRSQWERRACEAAAAICPAQAIAAGGSSLEALEPGSAPEGDLFTPAADTAEAVRWKTTDLPWNRFDPVRATPALRAVVREMAYSEQTTFSATQRFMAAFADDTDLTQWISVWFYEETRHPTVMLKWLELSGEKQDKDFVLKGRQSTPFMKSLTGTLATNIVSEMVASAAYMHMANGEPEPLIGAIARRLGGDEARHGSSFFAYARRSLETTPFPERERLDVLKVIHFWFNISQNVSHPVNAAMTRLRSLLPAINAPAFDPPNDRIARVIGQLLDLPISTPKDVPMQLLEHTKRVNATVQA